MTTMTTITSVTSPGASLRGARILVVEDEMLVSMHLEDVLTEFGCEVIGPAASIAKAIELATGEQMDGALLDLNLRGETVYAVAKILADRGTPFAFVTGYDAAWISETYRARPTLQKPIHAGKLGEILSAMLSPSLR